MKNVRIRAGFRVAVGVAALALPLSTAGTAFADPPGDNGTVKIHRVGTPEGEPDNEPHVCRFYLDATGFDQAQAVQWEIDQWAPGEGKGTKAASGAITLASGAGSTSEVTLPDGHYKLFWTFAGENGSAKHKVFWVDCGVPPTTPPTGGTTTSPGGSHSSPSNPATSSTPGKPPTSSPAAPGGTPTGSTGGTGGTTGGSTPTTPAPSATTPGAPGASTTPPSNGSLAHTGASGAVLYIALGAVALGGGGFALRRFAVSRAKG